MDADAEEPGPETDDEDRDHDDEDADHDRDDEEDYDDYPEEVIPPYWCWYLAQVFLNVLVSQAAELVWSDSWPEGT